MDYREIRPSPPLAPFVECIWRLSADDAGEAPPEPVLPDGCMELIVHLGESFRRGQGAGTGGRQPAAFLVGQLTRPLVLRPAGRVETLGIRFRPGGAFPFLAGGLDALADRETPLEDLWGRAGRELEERLRDAGRTRRRAAIVESFLLGRLDGARRDLRAEGAVRAVLATRGRARVQDLARLVGVSRRQFERLFSSAVGLRPKLFSRIVRFQRVLRLARRPEPIGWAETAVRCGYFDQAHLIRDVRDFSDASPTDLRSAAMDFTAPFVSEERFDALFGDAFFQDAPRPVR